MCNSNATNTDKSINEQIKELFDKNLVGQVIAYDGAVNEEKYNKQDFKVVFLLKEVNDKENKKSCSLVDWLATLNSYKKKTWKKTWLNVCYWCEILKDLNANFTEICNKKEEEITENLHEIAAVNIKKTNGGSSSVYAELEDAVKQYGDLTLYEIEKIIQPKLVICCGTFELAQMLFNKDNDKNELENVQTNTLPCGVEYFEEKGIYYLKFVHPAWYTVNHNILFAYAKVAFGEIINVIKQNTCND